MKMYKGFDENLKCRGFQYEVGKEYETETAELCSSGFHACENPLDVFNYYDPTNRFCEVDLDATDEVNDKDSKRCGKHIKVVAEIGLSGLIKAGVKFILDKVSWENNFDSNTGDFSVATNTGDYSAATNTGVFSAATNTGNRSAATNTGDFSAATNTGNHSVATNTGNFSAATNIGNHSVATNTGDFSAAEVNGTESIAVVTGFKSKAKGSLGCWLVLTERDADYHILDVQSVKVDGENFLSNTFYTLKNGEIIPVE